MLFYISALVLGVIAGAFIAVIVSSFRPNRARNLYNRLQNNNQNNSLRRSAYNAVNVNSVLDKDDDLWGDEERSADESNTAFNKAETKNGSKDLTSDSSPSGIHFTVGGNSASSSRSRKGKKVYVAGPGMFNASQFHGEAPEGIAVIEVEEHQVDSMVKMVLQHPDFIRQAFAMSRKMVITLDELMDIWEVLSGDKVPEGARRSARS